MQKTLLTLAVCILAFSMMIVESVAAQENVTVGDNVSVQVKHASQPTLVQDSFPTLALVLVFIAGIAVGSIGGIAAYILKLNKGGKRKK